MTTNTHHHPTPTPLACGFCVSSLARVRWEAPVVRNTFRVLAFVAGMALIAAVWAALLVLLPAPQADAARPPVTRVQAAALLPACPTDEGPDVARSARPCLWDADRQGNGTGRSYVVTRSGRVVYLDGPVRLVETR